MPFLRLQYVLAYSITGAMLPYISVYFRQKGLSQIEIGYILAIASAAVVLSPIIVTLLADTRIDARHLMSGLFALSLVGMMGTYFASGFWLLLAAWMFYSLAYVPILPLQDGINLNLQERRISEGLSRIAYYRIRVWGTVGFCIPGVALVIMMRNTQNVSSSLMIGSACAVVGAINALLLPDPAIRKHKTPSQAMGSAGRLPAIAAIKALLKPQVVIFCIATFLLNTTTSSYYGFYSIYLKEVLHLDSLWLSPIMILGTVIEIAFVLSYGKIIRRFSLRGLMIGSTLTIILRLALLGLTPGVFVAVATQTLHGVMVLALQVAPVIYLNQQAEDRYRHSMQGLYTMFGIGTARIVGSLFCGMLAKWSLTDMFTISAAISVVALILLAVAFREPKSAGTSLPEPAD